MPVFCTFDRVAGLNFNKDKQGRRKQVKDNNDGEALPQVTILKDKGENQITIEDDNLSHSIKDSHYVGCLFLCATKKELTRHEQTPQSMRKKSLSAITSK